MVTAALTAAPNGSVGLFGVGEVADPDAGAPVDLAQDERLEGGYADLLRLLAQAARHAQQGGTQGFGEIGRRKGYYPKPDGTRATAIAMRLDLA